MKDVQNNEVSFCDVIGLRGGAVTDFSTENILRDGLSFRRLADEQYCPDVRSMYQNPNFTSEYGVAIYGSIQSDNIEYVEIERAYDAVQREALRADLKAGDDSILL